jgi:nucleoside-diphosphate-sugar epimerase
MFPGRKADTPPSLGGRAPRIPRVRDALRDDRNPYSVYGYKRKQVRDAIHGEDPIRAFHEFFQAPRVAEVYNIGGRSSNATVIEAIELAQEIEGEKLSWTYEEANQSATISGG